MPFDSATYEVDPLTLTTPRERLEYLRDFMRRLPAERFAMASCGALDDANTGFCGSPSCIGGWARAIWRTRGNLLAVGVSLGLTENIIDPLFFPTSANMGNGESPYRATPTDAADVLDHLIATGEVDWSVARKTEA